MSRMARRTIWLAVNISMLTISLAVRKKFSHYIYLIPLRNSVHFMNSYYRFTPRTDTDDDYVYFHHYRLCKSTVGKNLKGGKHKVYVGACDVWGSILHEMHHILGL